MSVNNILLPKWKVWDTGIDELPAKDITLKDGQKGSIVIGVEGVCVYDKTVKQLSEASEMGICFIHMSQGNDTMQELAYLLKEEDIKESKIILQDYREHEDMV